MDTLKIALFLKKNPKNLKEAGRQRLIQAVFNIGIPILVGTLIWLSPNLTLSKTETILKRNSSF